MTTLRVRSRAEGRYEVQDQLAVAERDNTGLSGRRAISANIIDSQEKTRLQAAASQLQLRVIRPTARLLVVPVVAVAYNLKSNGFSAAATTQVTSNSCSVYGESGSFHDKADSTVVRICVIMKHCIVAVEDDVGAEEMRTWAIPE